MDWSDTLTRQTLTEVVPKSIPSVYSPPPMSDTSWTRLSLSEYLLISFDAPEAEVVEDLRELDVRAVSFYCSIVELLKRSKIPMFKVPAYEGAAFLVGETGINLAQKS